MRAQLLQATSVHLLAFVLGASLGWPAQAQEAMAGIASSRATPSARPFAPASDAGSSAISRYVPLPESPLAPAGAALDADSTGSIPAGSERGPLAARTSGVPAALSFDEGAVSSRDDGPVPFTLPDAAAAGTPEVTPFDAATALSGPAATRFSFPEETGSAVADAPGASPVKGSLVRRPLPASLPADPFAAPAARRQRPMPQAGLPAPPAGTVATLADPATSALPPMPMAAPAPKVVVVPSDAPAPTAAAPVAVPSSTAAALEPSTIAMALTTFAGEAIAADTPAQAGERRKTREAIAAFYAAHAAAPLWIVDGRLSPAARSVMARLDHAAEDGLDLRRFAVPVPRDGETATLVRADLALSEATVAYGRQASGSRVDVARLGGLIDLRPAVADVDHILGTVPGDADAGEVLHAFNPPQPGYAALRQKLAELRRHSTPEAAQDRIPAGPILRPGMKDARVPLIRARFGLDVASVEPGIPQLAYDTQVAAAVADFQRAHGLPASGLLTPRTIAALSGGNPSALENAIVANMELWRWLPRDLGPDRIEVNIPDYTASVVRDGAVVHHTRVVVGQPDKPTPVFSEQMRFIIVNPYWNVPLSIIKKEMMPKLASDPNYFANHGYEVVERDGVTYVRQPPGDGNALGRIKFMFPNVHAVYLHDTNARSFFGREMRALSHGCVRVEQPFSFAEAVMGPANGWSEARIRKLIGGQERTINLPKPLPVFITYFTAFVDPLSGFQMRNDVYGYTGRVEAALGLPG